jgi:hypothetical protein
MFFDLRTVVQRHFPTAEIDDFCTLQNVSIVESGFKAHRNLAAKNRDTGTLSALPLCP